MAIKRTMNAPVKGVTSKRDNDRVFELLNCILNQQQLAK